MVEDNKMWEGHRIIYPHLRDKYLESKKIPLIRPVLDQQKLENLQYSLAEALARGGPVRITVWSAKGPQEKKLYLPPGQACVFRQGNVPVVKGLDELGRSSNIRLDYVLEINY